MHYDKLFSEANIGNMRLKNRLLMAPMGTNFGQENMALSERQLTYYAQRAKGGISLIITESAPVDPKGIHGRDRIQVWRDDAAEQLCKLTAAAHGQGCNIVLQLTHAGSKCSPSLIGEYPVAPSSVVIAKKDYIPRGLSSEEIDELIGKFAKAAKVGLEAGFDGIELLAASGHLIHQFLSPVSNKRMDNYGGPLRNRLRFLTEIIQRIKETTAGRLPILVKIYGRDPENPEGTQIPDQEWHDIIGELDTCGVASLHFSTNYAPDPQAALAQLVQLTGTLRKKIKAKIAVAGSILTPEHGEAILEAEQADFIEMGRAMLADADFPNKARLAREQDIRPCLNCNRCRYELNQKHPIRCTVNPFLGREQYSIDSVRVAPIKKDIIIVGAGPAGLQAALCLSERGYRGTIYERNDHPGGLLWSAAVAPGKERMGQFRAYLTRQAEQSNFTIEYNKEVTAQDLERFALGGAQAIIVACGALSYLPEGIDMGLANVYLGVDILTQQKVLTGDVVVLGGGQVGCETADYLSERGARVTLMSSSPGIAKNVYSYERTPLLKRLGDKDVKILINSSPTAFAGAQLFYRHLDQEKTMPCDALVIAKGWKPNSSWKELLEQQYQTKVFIIGDALNPQNLMEALQDGLETALQIEASEQSRT